jgi:hypothetical protein
MIESVDEEVRCDIVSLILFGESVLCDIVSLILFGESVFGLAEKT